MSPKSSGWPLRAAGALSQDVEDEYGMVRRKRAATLADDGGRWDAALDAHVLERRHHVVGVVLDCVIERRRRVRRCALHSCDRRPQFAACESIPWFQYTRTYGNVSFRV